MHVASAACFFIFRVISMSRAFGKHLEELRTTGTNYTPEQMAEFLNTDLKTYNQFETGEIEPSVNRMYILTKVLRVDFVELMEYEDDNNIASAQK